jgi:hypothetical protein
MPRFKLRALGDRIRYNDQILLENVQAGSDPTFLHTEDTQDDHGEVIVYSSPSKTTGIRVKLFAPFNVSRSEPLAVAGRQRRAIAYPADPLAAPCYFFPSKAFEHVLKGGDYVRLYHSEGNGKGAPLLPPSRHGRGC